MHVSYFTSKQASTKTLMLVPCQAVSDDILSARLWKPPLSPSGMLRHQLHTLHSTLQLTLVNSRNHISQEFEDKADQLIIPPSKPGCTNPAPILLLPTTGSTNIHTQMCPWTLRDNRWCCTPDRCLGGNSNAGNDCLTWSQHQCTVSPNITGLCVVVAHNQKTTCCRLGFLPRAHIKTSTQKICHLSKESMTLRISRPAF